MPAKNTPRVTVATLAADVASLTSAVQALAGIVAQNVSAPEVGVEVEAPSKTTRKAPARKSASKSATKSKSAKVREYRWRPWACARFGITPEVGATFEYVSKRSGGTRLHTVTRVVGDEVFSVAK